MEDKLNGRKTQWNTNSVENKWRITSMEDILNGRQRQWRMTSMEDNRMMTTLACLASQFCTELGPAQPQLVHISIGTLNSSTTPAFNSKGFV